jgi:hypothetical protein
MQPQKFIINSCVHRQLFAEGIFKILDCSLLWIAVIKKSGLQIITTNTLLLEHYLEKKYYLSDPDFKHSSPPTITIGTNCKNFYKNSFIYNAHNMFNIEEFISATIFDSDKKYCFRFFTNNNRFNFINKFLQNKAIIEYFINNIIKKIKIGDLIINKIK